MGRKVSNTVFVVLLACTALQGIHGCRSNYRNPDFLAFIAEHPTFVQDSLIWEYPPKELYDVPPFRVAGNSRIISFDTTTDSNFLMVNPYELYDYTDSLNDTLHIGPIGFNGWKGQWRATPEGIEIRFAETYRDIPRVKRISGGVIEHEQLPGKDTTLVATIEKLSGGGIALKMLDRRFVSHDLWSLRSHRYLIARPLGSK